MRRAAVVGASLAAIATAVVGVIALTGVSRIPIAEYLAEAVDWIREHPGEFLGLTASRTTQFWLGPFDRPGTALAVTALTILALLGAWRGLPAMTPPQRWALLIPLICYPLVYYVVIYMPRYRVPLDWILLLLAGAAVWRGLEGLPKADPLAAA